MKLKVEIGKKYGNWIVKAEAPRIRRISYFECVCSCGKTKRVREHCLTRGLSIRCGSCRSKVLNVKHLLSKSRSYNSWNGMLRRCEDKDFFQYHYYGGRGIKVCEEWHDIEKFYKDMGERPIKHSLERIDNNGNYEPKNCRWATAKEQAANKRPRTMRK